MSAEQSLAVKMYSANDDAVTEVVPFGWEYASTV